MKQRWIKAAAACLALTLAVPVLTPAQAAWSGETAISVGLFYGSSALPSANLENSVGSGYRLGYFDGSDQFTELGRILLKRKFPCSRPRISICPAVCTGHLAGPGRRSLAAGISGFPAPTEISVLRRLLRRRAGDFQLGSTERIRCGWGPMRMRHRPALR